MPAHGLPAAVLAIVLLPILGFPGESRAEETSWNVTCLSIDDTAGGDFFSLGGPLGGDPCRYQDRATGDEHQIAEDERAAVAADLESAYSLLRGEGYDEPAVPRTPEGWRAKMFPGDCWCTKLSCCTQTDDAGDLRFRDPATLGIFFRLSGGQIAEKGELLIKALGRPVDAERGITAAHELFHAVVWKDTRDLLDTAGTSPSCLPSCWIGEGIAEAFGYHWAGTDAGWNRTWDRSLHTGETLLGYQTGQFWTFVAERYGGFGTLRPIFQKDYTSGGGGTGEGVAQVHEVLQGAVDGGLRGAYLEFVGTLTARDEYDDWFEVRVERLDEDFHLELAAFEPISVRAGEVRASPDVLEEDDGPGGTIELVVGPIEEGHPDLRLLVDGKLQEDGEHREDVTEELSNGELKRIVQVANVADAPEDSETRDAVGVPVRLEKIGCPFLPTGVSRLEYDLIGSDGKTSSRITYELDVEGEETERQSGEFDFSVYSVDLERVLTSGESDFECTERGMRIQGWETAYAPGFEDTSLMDMRVVADSNYFPARPRPGMDLPDSELVVEGDFQSGVAGLMGITIATSMTNRRIAGEETVVVPAGTFEAMKLTFDSSISLSFSGAARLLNMMKGRIEQAGRASVTTWYSRGVGIVRSESRTSDGTTVFQLTGLVRTDD